MAISNIQFRQYCRCLFVFRLFCVHLHQLHRNTMRTKMQMFNVLLCILASLLHDCILLRFASI